MIADPSVIVILAGGGVRMTRGITTDQWQGRWVERYYRSRPGWTDGTTEFHAMCRARIAPGTQILEVGAGPGNRTSAFLASIGTVHGVDVDREALSNPHLASAKLIVGGRIPHADEAFDAAVSNYVAEHVENPAEHLSELHRVLRPGGVYILRTPNLLHYVALFSWLTPHAVHRVLANPLRNHSKQHHHPYPTNYAMNTPRRVRGLAADAGFHVDSLRMVEKEPSYGMYARPLFLAFMAYERLVNASAVFEPFRANMFLVLRTRG